MPVGDRGDRETPHRTVAGAFDAPSVGACWYRMVSFTRVPGTWYCCLYVRMRYYIFVPSRRRRVHGLEPAKFHSLCYLNREAGKCKEGHSRRQRSQQHVSEGVYLLCYQGMGVKNRSITQPRVILIHSFPHSERREL